MTSFSKAREAAARAICIAGGFDPNDITPDNGGGDWPFVYIDAVLSAFEEAGLKLMHESALRQARADALEEAAALADIEANTGEYTGDIARVGQHRNLAISIRALKHKDQK